MLKEFDFLLPRVLAWPEVAKEQLMRAVQEAQHDRICSRPGDGQTSSSGQVAFIADAETEAFFKRHSFWF